MTSALDVVKNNLEAIYDACRKHHIESLYVFGSAARGVDFTQKSDLDFLYRFKQEDILDLDYADNFFDLKFSLERLTGRDVDLISVDHLTNPYLIKKIEESKIKLYAA